ncbi:MAG: lipid-A-disaccharide synthase [Acidobacteria bacterium]|nr:MAG: lipid-A-disaccharide synthase [Acidobacteriota bacterium]
MDGSETVVTAKSYKIMIVAGEASGDLHAAKLANAIREASPDVSLFGACGPKMRDSGVEAIVDADNLSIVGLPEIGRALPMFLRVFRKLKQTAIERRPDVVVLVDFPDFNLKLAKSLHKLGFKIVYYISPQLWAWRKYRIKTIKKYVDLLISILPFEKDWYSKHGVDHVEYVGSPLAREVHPTRSREEFREMHGLSHDRPLIALLPGSRHKEIVRILPVMLRSIKLLSIEDPAMQFVIAAASDKSLADIDRIIDDEKRNGMKIPGSLLVVQNETFNALNSADVAAVASGTATLETGIIGTPMAIVYKSSALNYKLLRPLIDVEHFGLINLIAGERVAAELIQDDFTGESLKDELLRLLEPEENANVRKRLHAAAEKLGHGGASKRAAELILKLGGKS